MTDDAVQSSALDALTQLHAEMQREFHHHAVDLPVSVNLDDWIARLATFIAALRAEVATLTAAVNDEFDRKCDWKERAVEAEAELVVIEQKLRRAVEDPALWRSDIFAVRMAVSACADQIAALRRKD